MSSYHSSYSTGYKTCPVMRRSCASRCSCSGMYDVDIQSRLEPSKLLSENEMLRKRVFELELLVNRKLNELPDEIALLQSENNHLKSLCHARLAEIEEWKRLLHAAKLEGQQKFEQMRVDFESRFLSEVEKGVAEKLSKYGSKISSLETISSSLDKDNRWLTFELEKIFEKHKFDNEKKDYEFKALIEKLIRQELIAQENVFKSREMILEQKIRALEQENFDLSKKNQEALELITKLQQEMADKLRGQEAKLLEAMQKGLHVELENLKKASESDNRNYIQTIQDLEKAYNATTLELENERKIHIQNLASLKSEYETRIQQMKTDWEAKSRAALTEELSNIKLAYQNQVSQIKRECDFIGQKLNEEVIVRDKLLNNQIQEKESLIEAHLKAREREHQAEVEYKNRQLLQSQAQLLTEKERNNQVTGIVDKLIRESLGANELNRIRPTTSIPATRISPSLPQSAPQAQGGFDISDLLGRIKQANGKQIQCV